MHSSVCAPRTTSRPIPRSASTDSRSVASKASAYSFCTSDSPSRRTSSGDELPGLAVARQVVVVVLDPDDIHAGRARLLDQAGDVGDHVVAVVGLTHHAVLHVDDEQGGVRTVLERRHRLMLGVSG